MSRDNKIKLLGIQCDDDPGHEADRTYPNTMHAAEPVREAAHAPRDRRGNSLAQAVRAMPKP